ncbi:MAG: Holliday junction branch migration protein RuvA [Lachnospiraceae bacterium]|nr:Holliday junction branch migration protein RuvA [Lachnospiraceae bacterium]
MISYLRGVCAETGEDYMVVDVGGVGFKVGVSGRTAELAPGTGELVTLHTHMSVREDDLSLFGFLTKEELHVFRQLLSVNGVGPKAALSVLSAVGIDDLRFAILTGDTRLITKAPGIGKKIAERMVLELKDRFSSDDLLPRGGETQALSVAGEETDEALAALMALGYGASEAGRAVAKAREEAPEVQDPGKLLQVALKYLG